LSIRDTIQFNRFATEKKVQLIVALAAAGCIQRKGSSGFRMVHPGNIISAQELGDCTAEARRARSKEFLIKK
jgi:hypothetical protein